MYFQLVLFRVKQILELIKTTQRNCSLSGPAASSMATSSSTLCACALWPALPTTAQCRLKRLNNSNNHQNHWTQRYKLKVLQKYWNQVICKTRAFTGLYLWNLLKFYWMRFGQSRLYRIKTISQYLLIKRKTDKEINLKTYFSIQNQYLQILNLLLCQQKFKLQHKT